MSQHKIPLTISEFEGLCLHGLPEDSPSQLSDCFRNGMKWQAALSQSEPAQVSQPVGEIVSNGSVFFRTVVFFDGSTPDVGTKLFSSPPDYEALKAENTLLKEVEKSFADLSENLQNDCASLKLRVAELEAATEHLGLTPQQAKDGLSRHKALVAERDRLQSECDRLRDAAKQALLALHYHTEQTRPIDTSVGAMNALNAALMPAQKEQEK